jgi:type II secretory pathway component GspD/PulD (secretin)
MKLRRLFLALGSALVALVTLAAPGVCRELPAAAGNLDERINIALTKAPPVDVFKSFGQLTGMPAVVDPALRGELSIVLENVRVRTALDAACESLDCHWNVENGKLVITVLGPGARKAAASSSPSDPLDLKVTDADVRDLLKTFGQMIGAEVVLDPALVGKATFDLQNVPWDKALDQVCRQSGCDWSLTDGPSGGKKVLKFVAKTGRKGV